ncbi:helix-turn-helix domain-containing protein [Ezakiella coagulans]|uniref:helix-turn-helix domain-containing protein n=1 Tax=Ezakiella coagulans TaxID=46507 RepID=UPI00288983CD|nr:helix-turn-helix domain-containing protein [Ezakiella coagulans]
MSKITYKISKNKYDKAVELLASGEFNQTEIADEVKISRNTVAKIQKDPETAKIIYDSTDSNIKLALGKAGKTLISLLNARSEKVRLEAAIRILELCGIQVTDKIDIGSDLKIVFEDDYGD